VHVTFMLLINLSYIDNKVISHRHDKEGIIGCILADHAGLCLGGNKLSKT